MRSYIAHKAFRRQGGQVYTTDYGLDETFTLLFKRLPFPLAQSAMTKIDSAILAGYLQLEWITPERFARTKSLRIKFQDKPQISFTDLSSIAVIEELAIPLVMTGDAHFTHVDINLQLVPS